MGDMFAMGGLFAIVATLFLIVVGILWIILPFAVFGLKSRLERVHESNERTNTLLNQICEHLVGLRKDVVQSVGKSSSSAGENDKLRST
jgi:hypothetical protein